jgi:hypothetical protein
LGGSIFQMDATGPLDGPSRGLPSVSQLPSKGTGATAPARFEGKVVPAGVTTKPGATQTVPGGTLLNQLLPTGLSSVPTIPYCQSVVVGEGGVDGFGFGLGDLGGGGGEALTAGLSDGGGGLFSGT